MGPRPPRRAGRENTSLSSSVTSEGRDELMPDGIFKGLQEVRDVGDRMEEIVPFAC